MIGRVIASKSSVVSSLDKSGINLCIYSDEIDFAYLILYGNVVCKLSYYY